MCIYTHKETKIIKQTKLTYTKAKYKENMCDFCTVLAMFLYIKIFPN